MSIRTYRHAVERARAETTPRTSATAARKTRDARRKPAGSAISSSSTTSAARGWRHQPSERSFAWKRDFNVNMAPCRCGTSTASVGYTRKKCSPATVIHSIRRRIASEMRIICWLTPTASSSATGTRATGSSPTGAFAVMAKAKYRPIFYVQGRNMPAELPAAIFSPSPPPLLLLGLGVLDFCSLQM